MALPHPDYTKLQPEELVPLLLKEDPAAQECFFRYAHGKLCGWALYRFGIEGSQAEDFALEVLTKALNKIQRFKSERGCLTTWLFTIARNHAADSKRHREPLDSEWLQLEEWLEEAAPATPEAPTGWAEDYDAAERAIRTFEEADQKLFDLALGSSLSSAAIAEELGLTASQVRQRKKRLLAKLRQQLADGIPTPD